jgi:hypothetical protein
MEKVLPNLCNECIFGKLHVGTWMGWWVTYLYITMGYMRIVTIGFTNFFLSH